MANLSQDQLRRLARLGAKARLEELRQEEAAIRAEFPDLFGRGPKQAAGARGSGQASGGRRRRRRRQAMSPAQRKLVSERMRKYWAERRKAKAGK